VAAAVDRIKSLEAIRVLAMKGLSTLTLLCLAIPAALWGGWESETVVSTGDVGAGCCLAMDRWGQPHISYVDKTRGEVVYARYTGSDWEFETVASGVEVQGLTAIGLDAFDHPHIVFSDEGAGQLTYAYRSGTAWVTEKIVDATNNLYVSIYAWGSGPHVSYAKLDVMTSLRYAYRDDGEWLTESIASGGEFNRIFLDNSQTPHVVFYGSGKIKHASRGATEWTVGEIAEGIYCDAIVGPDGKIHVSFTSLDNEDLMYAVSAAGETWDVEEAGTVQGNPARTGIALNGAGQVFISYYRIPGFDLYVGKKSGASWTYEVIATGGDAGNPHSIAPAPGGYPLVAYYDAIQKDLKLARYDPLSDVELTYFTAERSRAGVDVRWAARGDGGVAGYNLFRAAEGRERERVNPSLIAGASPFLYRDARAENDVAYDYWLELVPLHGKSRTFGPASVPPSGSARAFALFQNAPNPVSSATTFTFELAEGADVRLAVYDAAGRRVAVPAEDYFGPGRHDVPFACDLAPGVYVYRVEAGANVAARKMVVLK
jgi:hypothetical protein